MGFFFAPKSGDVCLVILERVEWGRNVRRGIAVAMIEHTISEMVWTCDTKTEEATIRRGSYRVGPWITWMKAMRESIEMVAMTLEVTPNHILCFEFQKFNFLIF